jgi:hypothetical protein
LRRSLRRSVIRSISGLVFNLKGAVMVGLIFNAARDASTDARDWAKRIVE